MTLRPLASQPTESWSALAAAVVAMTGEPPDEFDEDDEVPTPVPCENCDEYGHELDDDGLCGGCSTESATVVERPVKP